MPEPTFRHEGNLRLAGLPVRGYPADPLALADAVRPLIAEPAHAYGPPLLWYSLPPTSPGSSLSAWDGLVGLAITGLARPGAIAAEGQRLVVEDYRNLDALSLPHVGAIAALSETWTRLDAHARRDGWRVRPYWRLALRHRRLADGNVLPVADVAIFVDR